MIIFETLKIKNFKSIKDAELVYTAGVWEVKGINNDAPFDSNGSGKSTAMTAIQQCLFNKTTSPTPIDDVSFKAVGAQSHNRGYRLELTFSKNSDHYRIINDRKAMTIQVFKNHVDMMLKSIPNALKMITKIIGMDFTTFVTLTFISHDTIVGLLDNFSSSSLMKIILNFSQISEFEKRAKQEQKSINTEIGSALNQIQTINDSLNVLSQFKKIDLTPINKELVRLAKAKLMLEDTKGVELADFEDVAEGARHTMVEIQQELSSIKYKLDNSTCPTCGAMTGSTEKDLELLESTAKTVGVKLAKATLAYDEFRDEASRLRKAYQTAKSELQAEEQVVNNNLTVAKTKNQIYDDNKKQSDNFKSQLETLKIDHSQAEFKLSIIQASLKVLKEGDIQKSLLDSFVSVLNNYLMQFMKLVSLDYVGMIAVATRDSVSFKIHDVRFNQTISIHTLSGGEKTRLRLVVLLSMLQAVKALANVSSNILVFDESLDTLDSSAAEDLASLFAYTVKHDNKFIAMISHGQQLAAIDFVGKLTAEKTDGITEIHKEIT